MLSPRESEIFGPLCLGGLSGAGRGHFGDQGGVVLRQNRNGSPMYGWDAYNMRARRRGGHCRVSLTCLMRPTMHIQQQLVALSLCACMILQASHPASHQAVRPSVDMHTPPYSTRGCSPTWKTEPQLPHYKWLQSVVAALLMYDYSSYYQQHAFQWYRLRLSRLVANKSMTC